MWLPLFILLTGAGFAVFAQTSQPLEAPTQPFDFDHHRRTPLQARQTSVAWASRDNADLQRALISGERGKKEDISAQAAALFPDPREISSRQESEPLPTRRQLTDEITSANHGLTTKGQQDLLARGQVQDRLKLSTMSDSDYVLYVEQYRAGSEKVPPSSGEELLRPMPTLINPKTGGPPHAYAVSQAGVGARTEPRNNQNPFEALTRLFRLDQPVTKGTDALPSAPARLAIGPAPATPTTSSEPIPAATDGSPVPDDAKP